MSVSKWLESISVVHGVDLDSRKHGCAAAALFLAQAETDTKSDSRLVEHRRAAAARRKLLLESLIKLALLIGTNKYGWTNLLWSRSGLAN